MVLKRTYLKGNFFKTTMPLAKDLLYPLPEEEKRRHKLKRLVQHPNSYFLDIKCANCSNIKTGVFSHSQCVITCNGCSKVLTVSTGGKMKIVMEGCRFRRAKN